MGRIGIDYLKPGMVLGKTVADAKGRVLLGKGTELTARHLDFFVSREITHADIEGVTEESIYEDSKAQFEPDLFKRAELLTKHQFSHTKIDHEAMVELMRTCTLRRAYELRDGSEMGDFTVLPGAAEAPNAGAPGRSAQRF